MPSHRCKHPTCPTLLPSPGFCAKHEALKPQANADRHRGYDQQQRNTEAKAFYSSAGWLKTRAIKLAASPFCEDCQRRYATDVHHKVPVRDSEALRLAMENLVSLCGVCHKRLEARRVAAKRRRFS